MILHEGIPKQEQGININKRNTFTIFIKTTPPGEKKTFSLQKKKMPPLQNCMQLLGFFFNIAHKQFTTLNKLGQST